MSKVVKAEGTRWLEEAVSHIREGRMIVFPTETVYGIGVNLESPLNILRLQRAKGRNEGKPITLMTGSVEAAEPYFKFDEASLGVARKFFPGPLTLVLERSSKIPPWFFPDREKVGIRVPAEDTALAILRAFGGLMAVTSANASSAPPAVNFGTALFYFANEEDVMIVDGGESTGKQASTVAEMDNGRITVIRPGPISPEELEEAVRGGK